MNPRSHLGRADIASHLKVSLRSVDRFIERHGLRSGPGRQVLVRRERYAWCLVTLRHQSTRSQAPRVGPGMPPPAPFQPGEELVLLASTEDGFPWEEAAQAWAPGCTVRTPEECPPEHWLWSVTKAAKAMAGVRRITERGPARPTPAGKPAAARYLRRCLHEAHAYDGQPLDGAVLARLLRHLPTGERRLLFEALAEEVADSARAACGAPLDYVREPVLTEDELAGEMRRSVGAVRRWRVDGTGPVFLRVERTVRYARVDVNQWLDSGGLAP